MATNLRTAPAAVALGALLIAGCAGVPPQSGPSEEESPRIEVPEAARPPVSPKEYPVAPFDKEVLYDLLVAEIAGYRDQLDVALDRYWELTRKTRDPGVAGRTVRLATYLKNDDVAREAAVIWAEVDPDNIDAHRYAANQLVRSGEYDKAVGHMYEVKRLGGFANFEQVAYRAASLDEDAREALLKTIVEMVARDPDDTQLLYSMAVLLAQEERAEEALAITEQLMRGDYDVNVTVLHVDLMRTLGQEKPARALVRKSLREHPDEKRLRSYFARWLFEEGDLDGAKEEYEELLARDANDSDVLFALALIAMEQERSEDAAIRFHQMVRLGRRAGEAHYYLGSIAERNDDPDRALEEYRQVSTGYEFIPAQGRIVAIMAERGQLEAARGYLERTRAEYPEMKDQLVLVEAQLLTDRSEAAAVFEFLDEMLARDPDNVDLLYFRAMTGESAGDLELLERDLRRVLELEPDNADALNALGYTLTDRTDRHEEALGLITRALELRPDEPAFIDSMGWVLYRLENYEEAIVQLRRALSLLPNDEIAAHLGEVLWVVGDTEEAKRVWEEGLKLAPDSEILKAVSERLQQ